MDKYYSKMDKYYLLVTFGKELESDGNGNEGRRMILKDISGENTYYFGNYGPPSRELDLFKEEVIEAIKNKLKVYSQESELSDFILDYDIMDNYFMDQWDGSVYWLKVNNDVPIISSRDRGNVHQEVYLILDPSEAPKLEENKVLRTLATGQSDITRHEAYTKVQGLNWANANVPNYVVADKFNGHEYVDLGLPSGTLWAKMNVGATSETDNGLYFAWGETQGYTAEQVGVDKLFTWADYKFNPSGDGSTFTKYNLTDDKTVLDLEDDAASINMGGNWHMPSEDLILELLACTTHGFIDTTGQFTKFIPDSNSPICLPSDDSTESTTAFNGVAGYIFFKDGKSLSESISNGEYIFMPVNYSAFNGSLRYGRDTIEYEVTFYSNFIDDVDLPLSFIFSKLPAGTAPNGRDITSACSVASPRFAGNPVRGVIGQLEHQGGNEGGNRGGTSR